MKIVGFETDAGPRLGVIVGEEVVDLQAVDPTVPDDLAAALARHNGDLGPLGDIAARAPAFARRPLAGLRYALPVARPGKIIWRGLNSFVPHLQPLTRPLVSETFDYEAELVAVIGKRAKHMTLENAISCVAGWTCANEGSIREFQRHTTQWHAGKNFDHSGSLGPWIVTADALPPGGKGLKIESRVNGKVMQSDNSSNMMFPVAETIVYATQGITLEPGDLLLTGTPSGVAHARKPPAWMRHGDVCEIEIEGIGILRNPIEDEKA